MQDVKLQTVVRSIRAAAGAAPAGERTDRQLLRAFVARGEQPAFAALVERHGEMVLRVCRRVLRQEQDAEDAFQATFLVFAGKAGAIRKTESLACWLHGVAHRVALRARRDAGRRRAREREACPMSQNNGRREPEWSEVQTALDEEVQALPERYRGPFVLCFLEGRSRAEAARELGIKEGTVWSRLSHARKLLHEKLIRRGITLPALLAAAALGDGVARAVPARLADATVQAALAAGQLGAPGLVPARALALANGVIKAMSMIQKKTIVLCLTLIALVAFAAGAAALGIVSALPPMPGPAANPPAPPPPVEQPQPAPVIRDAGEMVAFSGRVVGPDGKPVAGAKLTLWSHHGYTGHYKEWHPNTSASLQPKSLATSGNDGRFSATFRKADITENPLNMWPRPWRMVLIVAAAEGFGPGWVSLDRPDTEAMTLRLVKDDVPVTCRVLNLEGRPVAGAAVRVVRLTVNNDLHHSLWQTSWVGLPGDVKTGPDGRFKLTGLGRGRSVLLSIEGSVIEQKLIECRTPAADAPAVPVPEVTVLAGPTKPIEGTVRITGTDKPIAGVVVYGEEEAHQRRVRAVTDARGHYRLVGLGKAKSYALTFYPSLESGCLGAFHRVVETVGLAPITADVEVRRGVEVRCRFIDKQTREPIQGELHYTPLESNPYYREAEEERDLVPNRVFRRICVPGPDGVFRLVVYPGLGMLFGMLQGNAHRYLHGAVDPADLTRTKGSFHMDFARLTGIYRLIEPKEGDRPITVDIVLDPGRKVSGSLISPDGKPVTGAKFYGSDGRQRLNDPSAGQLLKGDTFTAELLDPSSPRMVSFMHHDRKLVGHAVLRGDEKGPVKVRLEPWAVVTGRLVDRDGKPAPGVHLGWRQLATLAGDAVAGLPFTTDKDGRFRIEGLAADLKLEIFFLDGKHEPAPLAERMVVQDVRVKAGQIKDVGDVRVRGAAGGKKP